jgi:hypothetical protein
MARPLRIVIPDAWYHHVMSRGNRCATLFWEDTDRRRFLGLVSELPERFHFEVQAFVLRDNHYHLLVRTPQANLSPGVEVSGGGAGGAASPTSLGSGSKQAAVCESVASSVDGAGGRGWVAGRVKGVGRERDEAGARRWRLQRRGQSATRTQ